ncbi:uncharacterized protein LOC111314556 isoform X3 [Durio zibethinus]|uniref:Uncharacterized protein LOC111314556 isoform X3 n=1 Tax=Durio zibethinus TaxID=66656 RepID=A0A6P6B3M3_DURZI|nr:uncharacterized protein LOC111314556 isoform X3 [Durio zibethinus]
MTAADAGSMRGSEATSPSNLLLNNLPLITAFLAFAIAQFLKLFTNWFKERRWDSKRMIDSGGMPSSHSATVTALAVAIGLQDGTGGPAFAIAVVLACVVMYDASGVRLHASRQAELLNQIVCCCWCFIGIHSGFSDAKFWLGCYVNNIDSLSFSNGMEYISISARRGRKSWCQNLKVSIVETL